MVFKKPRKINRIFLRSLFSLVLALSFAMTSWAATGIYVGENEFNVGEGFYHLKSRAYLYYNSNTTEHLDISSMAQWVYNYGTALINYAEFYAEDGLGNDAAEVTGQINPEVETGEFVRIEADWADAVLTCGVSDTVYNKVGNPANVYTHMASGNSELQMLGNWEIFWMATGDLNSPYVDWCNF